MKNEIIILIAMIPYLTFTAFSIWKIFKLQAELQLHRNELIRLQQWSQNAATAIHDITQHLKYIVEMDKVKNQYPFIAPRAEA